MNGTSMNRSEGVLVARSTDPLPRLEIPRLPVFSPAAVSGLSAGSVPSVLDGRDFVLTTSGRAAIFLALRALHIGPGCSVLVPSYHCPTMVSPVVQVGAQPVFYGIDDEGLPRLAAIDLARAAPARAMLAAHWFGLPLDLTRVSAWCQERGIALIEDCAHAFFGERDGHVVGGVGTFSIASLTKFFPVPEGGCLVGDRQMLAAVRLRPAGAGVELRRVLDVIEIASRYGRLGWSGPAWHTLFALKAGLQSLRRGRDAVAATASSAATDAPEPLDEAARLRRPARVVEWIVQRADRQTQVEARRRNYASLAARLGGLRGGRPLRPELPRSACPYVFPFDVDDAEPVYAGLRAAGVPVFRWDRRWPGTPTAADDAGSRWATHVLQLGCHQDISPSEIEQMAAITRELLGA
jgi:hypothetical protein